MTGHLFIGGVLRILSRWHWRQFRLTNEYEAIGFALAAFINSVLSISPAVRVDTPSGNHR